MVDDIGRIPFAIKYGIFLYFSGCSNFLSTGTIIVEGKEIDLSVLYERGDSSDYADIGLAGILFSLAESKVFGGVEETDRQQVWDVMLRLYQVVTQMKDAESKSKKS